MKNRVIGLAVIGSIIMAGFVNAGSNPATVTVNDANFDYADTDLETGYLELAYDGELQLTLSSSKLSGDLPEIVVTVPELDGEDIFGNDNVAELADIDEIELLDYGRELKGFEVLHPDQSLANVANGYIDSLAALGFTARLEPSTANTQIVVFMGEQSYRAVFNFQGGDVTARIVGI